MPGRVLLTGRERFPRIHLLHDLLISWGATVTCLLRGESETRARQSLEEKWRWFFPETELEPHRERLGVLVADVTRAGSASLQGREPGWLCKGREGRLG